MRNIELGKTIVVFSANRSENPDYIAQEEELFLRYSIASFPELRSRLPWKQEQHTLKNKVQSEKFARNSRK